MNAALSKFQVAIKLLAFVARDRNWCDAADVLLWADSKSIDRSDLGAAIQFLRRQALIAVKRPKICNQRKSIRCRSAGHLLLKDRDFLLGTSSADSKLRGALDQTKDALPKLVVASSVVLTSCASTNGPIQSQSSSSAGRCTQRFIASSSAADRVEQVAQSQSFERKACGPFLPKPTHARSAETGQLTRDMSTQSGTHFDQGGGVTFKDSQQVPPDRPPSSSVFERAHGTTLTQHLKSKPLTNQSSQQNLGKQFALEQSLKNGAEVQPAAKTINVPKTKIQTNAKVAPSGNTSLGSLLQSHAISFFDTGSARISDPLGLLGSLSIEPGRFYLVTGSTDRHGSIELNRKLAKARALAAAKLLVEAGVDAQYIRLQTIPKNIAPLDTNPIKSLVASGAPKGKDRIARRVEVQLSVTEGVVGRRLSENWKPAKS
jgi:outer membrane protein OmpA-like peptidoglycan-associated protein